MQLNLFKNKFTTINIYNTKLVFIICFLTGYIVHGQIIFSKLLYHDEVYNYDGVSFPSLSLGRYFFFFMSKFFSLFFDTTSTNSFYSFFTFIIISICVCFLIEIFKIDNKIQIIILSILSITNLFIVCSFGYMLAAPYFAFSLLLAIIASYILTINFNFISVLFSTFFLSTSVGIYQSSIFIYSSIILFFFIYNKNKINIKNIIKSIFPVIVSVFLFFCFFKLYYIVKNMPPTSYKNIDNLGLTSFFQYVKRINFAYSNFIFPENNKIYSMYPGKIRNFYLIFILLYFCVFALYIYKKNSKNKLYNVLFLIFIGLIPLCINGIFVVAGTENVYAMNLWNYVILFYSFFYMLNQIQLYKHIMVIKVISYIILVIISFGLFKYADSCYNNLKLKVQNELFYDNVLVARIESIEGYSDKMPICFVEKNDPFYHRSNLNYNKNTFFDDIVVTPPYCPMCDYPFNSYSDVKFLEIMSGFNPKRIDYNEFGHEDAIRLMPVYPSDGSIKIIDNVVVVKMEDNY